MKVIINRCWGGFSVSNEVIKELVMANSDCIESYTPKYYYGGDNKKNKDWEEKFNEDYPSDYHDIGDGFMGHKSNFNIYKDGMFYDVKENYDDRDKIRSHPDLVKAVERLGKKANGSMASLAVVEIPDDVEFEIDNYDGMETVAEKHRTWS